MSKQLKLPPCHLSMAYSEEELAAPKEGNGGGGEDMTCVCVHVFCDRLVLLGCPQCKP